MRLVLAVASVTTLCACTSFATLEEHLPKYIGQPVDRMVARLGPPNSQAPVDGRRSYLWTTGPVIAPIAGSAVQSGSTTTVELPTNARLTCLVRVFIDPADRITGVRYAGYNRACQTYAERLAVAGQR